MHARYPSSKIIAMAPWRISRSACVLVLVVVSGCGCGISNIPTYDESVSAAWAELQTAFQQRADLVPALLDQLPTGEQTARIALADASARVDVFTISPAMLNNTDAFRLYQLQQSALGAALARATDIIVADPVLAATAHVQTLTRQLHDLEHRLSRARSDYTEIARRYNAELRTAPGVWWHRFLYSERKPKATLDPTVN